MIIQYQRLVLLGIEGWDNLRNNQSYSQIDILLVFEVQRLNFEQYLFRNGHKMFFIIDGKGEKPFKRLGLENERALIESPQ